MNQFLYHRAVDNMAGHILYSLNQLKDIYPEAYAEHVKKYAGREDILETKVPTLNCLWNDVLHLTAVPPQELLNNLVEGGLKDRNILWKKWFKIPIERIDPAKTTVCTYDPGIAENWDARMFSTFDLEKIPEYKTVPPETIKYYEQRFSLGEKPLMFHRMPHILFKGTIDVADLEIVEVQ